MNRESKYSLIHKGSEEAFYIMVKEYAVEDWLILSEMKSARIRLVTPAGSVSSTEILYFIALIKKAINDGTDKRKIKKMIQTEMLNEKVSGEQFLESKFLSNAIGSYRF